MTCGKADNLDGGGQAAVSHVFLGSCSSSETSPSRRGRGQKLCLSLLQQGTRGRVVEKSVRHTVVVW